jgi:hypothetical protein
MYLTHPRGYPFLILDKDGVRMKRTVALAATAIAMAGGIAVATPSPALAVEPIGNCPRSFYTHNPVMGYFLYETFRGKAPRENPNFIHGLYNADRDGSPQIIKRICGPI